MDVLLDLSPPQRLKGIFSGGKDPLRNVSAGIGLPATAQSHPGEVIFCTLLAGVACVPRVNKDGLQEFEVQ